MSSAADETLHQTALSYFDEGRFDEAEDTWARFETEYPESRFLPEVLYHIGLCRQRQGRPEGARKTWAGLIGRFPYSTWAGRAGERLDEKRAFEIRVLYNRAMELFDDGRYDEAGRLFTRVMDEAARDDLAGRAAYVAALCLFKAGRWAEARKALAGMLDRDLQGTLAAEARYHLGLVFFRLGQPEAARREFQIVLKDFPGTRWSDLAGNMLNNPEVLP